MAYTNPFKIANGLVLDFTLDAADADNDAFLGRNASGEVTSLSSIKATRISSGADLTEATSSVLTITGTGTLLGATSIQVKLAGAAQSGYLSSTDWNTFNDKIDSSLTDSYIFVGNGFNVAVGVAVSGDITMANDGTVAIASGVIVNADVNANAAIEMTKLESLTASRAVVTGGGGFFEVSTATAAQVGYLSNLSGDLQASLNSLGITIVGLTTNAIVQAPTASENGYAIVWDEGSTEWTLGPVGAGGSITGPGSSTDNAMVRWNGAAGTSIQNSGVILDDSDNITGVTSITVGQSGIHIFDTGDDHDLILASGEDLTADRTFSFVLGDADRTVTLSGSPTMGDWFDQSVKAAASVVFADATLSNTGGLHLLDSDSSHDLIIRTTENLSADRELVFITNDATRTLTVNASGTVYVTGGTDVAVADGGTGLSTIAALSILVANVLDTYVALTPAAGQSIRINAGGTGWEAYTPGGGGIGGSTGATDNAILRADGAGGSTLQDSSVVIDDTGNIDLGLASLAGGRTIQVVSNDASANLYLLSKGASGSVFLGRIGSSQWELIAGSTLSVPAGSQIRNSGSDAFTIESGVLSLQGWSGGAGSGAGGSVTLQGGDGGTTGANAGGNVVLRAGDGGGGGADGQIIMDELPTSDPGVTGALWSNVGILTVS